MLTSLLLVFSVAIAGPPMPAGQSAKVVSAPAYSAQELAVIVERVVRMADLQRRKLAVQQELAAQSVGDRHPTVLQLRGQLAEIEAAIIREGLNSYQADAHLLAERRLELHSELARLRNSLGPSHPTVRSTETRLAALREQQRVAAVAALAAGLEAELRAAITRDPDSVAPYLDLAGMLALAGRSADAATALTEAQAALKRAGGR